jgi:transcriptional regulator GlxA family with amidase domain
LVQNSPSPSIRNREVVIVGADGCLASGFLGFLDILGLAREVILSRTGEVPFDVVTASETGRAVTDGHGRSLEVQKRLSDIERCAAIVVPGFVPQGMKLPDMSAYADAADWIRREHAHGALACASCGGVYLLGRRTARRAPMHDHLVAARRTQAPLSALRRVVGIGADRRSRRRYGRGVLSWTDISLYVVRQLWRRGRAHGR